MIVVVTRRAGSDGARDQVARAVVAVRQRTRPHELGRRIPGKRARWRRDESAARVVTIAGGTDLVPGVEGKGVCVSRSGRE